MPPRSTPPKNWSRSCGLRGVLLAVAALAFLLPVAIGAPTELKAQAMQQTGSVLPEKTPDRQKLELEKLGLEVKKLKVEVHVLNRLLAVTSALVVPLALVVAGFFFNKRLNDLRAAEDARREEVRTEREKRREVEERAEQQFAALIEDRARAYALVFKELSPTAIFFPRPQAEWGGKHPSSNAALSDAVTSPSLDASAASEAKDPASPQLGKEDCGRLGHKLSAWYFGAGGLLMTEDARDTYFALMEALRMAALAEEELAVPTVGEHAKVISLASISKYSKSLAEKSGQSQKHPLFEKLEAKQLVKDSHLKDWKFGPSETISDNAERRKAEAVKDFVLIQKLASQFRTALTEDIRSRRAPGSRAINPNSLKA